MQITAFTILNRNYSDKSMNNYQNYRCKCFVVVVQYNSYFTSHVITYLVNATDTTTFVDCHCSL